MPAWGKFVRRMATPVDGAGLAVFRIVFGLVMAFAVLRFMTSGWIEEFYGAPKLFFPYWGFEWIRPLSVTGMYLLYGTLFVCALGIAAGLFYRACAVIFFVGFSYAQLIDVTNYLNHYYLAAMISLLLIAAPLHRTLSIDSRRMAPQLRGTVPCWALWLFRVQIGAVYVFAGLAKLTTDWLLHAQPMSIWLSARNEMPVVGPWLSETWVAYAMSWAGFLFDTTIVLWLSIRRTRKTAFIAVIGFHVVTRLLFNIGMFPFIMITCATVFFDPSWPRRFFSRREAPVASLPTIGKRHTAIALSVVVFSAFVVLMPLRHFVYSGDVLWTEEGMRFSWKVMVREKHGSVTFFVGSKTTGKELQVYPRRYLTARQEREMASQPDLIQALAKHIKKDFAGKGYGDVTVRAEALVSLNGRPARHLVDPTIDLATANDGLGRKRWITSDPTAPPIRLRHVSKR